MGGGGKVGWKRGMANRHRFPAPKSQGLRTFLESEVTKSSRRLDLLAKMVALDPDEPTAEEKENGVTKLRYMMFRERLSSTNTLGFRVEAIKVCGWLMRGGDCMFWL